MCMICGCRRHVVGTHHHELLEQVALQRQHTVTTLRLVPKYVHSVNHVGCIQG